MFDKIKGKLLFSVGLGALVFLVLSIYADFGDLKAAFSRFSPIFVLPTLVLALANYLLRFVRWQYYLRVLQIPLDARSSMIVFLAGLVLSVTPGKAGELLKAHFIRERLQIPISHSAPAVLCERLTDLIALILLAMIGVSTFSQGLMPLLIGAGILALLVLFLVWPGAAQLAINVMARLPVIRGLADGLRTVYGGVRRLVAPGSLVIGVGLGVVAWFAECLGFFLVLLGFGATIGAVPATFIYSFATLFGAVTMLPGGLGPTEGSMSGLLVLQEVPLATAVGAIFVIRICTLWFAVAIGAYVLLKYRRYFEWEPDDASGVLDEEEKTAERRT